MFHHFASNPNQAPSRYLAASNHRGDEPSHAELSSLSCANIVADLTAKASILF
jgi:hypothetical protein